ncbi:MAG: efflux RND transporter periplasmic adaptor subunit [Rhodocyclaceae bacterium]|nr:MAG: efflux RND transporter periplasmic adaptor subunit [Rhodocyclaceae bacterium]
MKRRLSPLFVAGVVLGAALLAACGREAPQAEPLRPVLTMVVGATESQAASVYAGEVRSRVEQSLGFRIAGKISERLIDAGAVIKPGQVLARLDPVDTALSAGAADAQRQLAEADAARFRELKAKNFVSQAALDSRETSLKAAAAQSDLSRNQTAYTVLKADQPGVVGQVLAEVGQVVSAGQPIFRIARQDTLEVAIAIPESRLAEARKASDAEVTLWAEEGVKYRGRLREIAAMADPQTRTYAARVAILDADPRVVFGMSASVRFTTPAGSKAVTIPLSALFQHDGKPAVWLVDDAGKLSLRAIEVGRYSDEFVAVSAGLSTGERIVVAGVHKLAAGQKIRIAERGADVAAANVAAHADTRTAQR